MSEQSSDMPTIKQQIASLEARFGLHDGQLAVMHANDLITAQDQRVQEAWAAAGEPSTTYKRSKNDQSIDEKTRKKLAWDMYHAHHAIATEEHHLQRYQNDLALINGGDADLIGLYAREAREEIRQRVAALQEKQNLDTPQI